MIAGLFSLEGRTALVTGGSRGIGRMIAEGFLAAGATVYISSRKADQCDAVAAELSAAYGDRCRSLPQDVASVEGCRALADRYAALEDGLDILVNNAGASWGAAFDDFPERGWDKVLDLNLKSPFFLTQALIRQLEARASADRPAKVINISSMDGFALNPIEAYSYPASKAGLIHLTRRLAARLIERHIVVTSIAPGNFASEMNVEAAQDEAKVAAGTPAGRLGQPEDMAAAAIYLASRAGDFVVGETIAVDGGIAFAKFA
jgi:NAD(P)-dependent dehydrogenase (short-subunit alcohol dehydrogenase family)